VKIHFVEMNNEIEEEILHVFLYLEGYCINLDVQRQTQDLMK